MLWCAESQLNFIGTAKTRILIVSVFFHVHNVKDRTLTSCDLQLKSSTKAFASLRVRILKNILALKKRSDSGIV